MQPNSTSVWSFHGNAVQALDSKGRVTVPARWRHEGMGLLLALPDDLQPALRLMPPAVLQALLDRVEADPDLPEDERDNKIRFHSSRAFE